MVAGVTAAACSSESQEDEETAEATAWGLTAKAKHFLTLHGSGSRAEANAYYARNISNFATVKYTLDQWKTDFVGTQSVTIALYRNAMELGFWREMVCTQQISRGQGGCYVTNWQNEGDKQAHVPNKGTVAMNVDPDGFTRFYVFLPNGNISLSAALDSEGPKFMPRVCTVCHAGSAPKPGDSGDLGSVFREFEPSLLEVRSGVSQSTANQEFYALNQAIRTANQAIRSESSGSPRGLDHARDGINAHIEEIYASGGTSARDVSDPAYVPSSWGSRFEQTPRTELWTKVINRYCMECHRNNALDWSDYSKFQYLQKQDHGKGLLQRYLDGDQARSGVPVMPQAKLAHDNLSSDTAAKNAIAVWLAPCVAGGACVTGNPCTTGKVSCSTGSPVCSVDTNVADGTSCGSGATCGSGVCIAPPPPPPPPPPY